MPLFEPDQYVEMTVHFKCNLRCEHCMILDMMKRLEPQGGDRFEQLMDYNRLNRRWQGIILTGAEATLREDLPELARKAKEGGFEHVRIQTHGMRLADRAYCRELFEAGIDEYFVSVTASDAQSHDAITKVSGSFEKTMKGLKNLDEMEGVKILSNTVVTRRSVGHLMGIVEMLGNLRRLVEMDFWGYWPMEEKDERDLIVGHEEAAGFLVDAIRRAQELGRHVEVKNFPECLMGEFGDALHNTQPRLFIDPEFWPLFMRNGFHQCVHRPKCGSKECLGLNTAYIKKFGWEEKLFSPIPMAREAVTGSQGEEVLETARLLGRFGVERSIGVREGAVYANRFLASLSLPEMKGDGVLESSAQRLRMPGEMLERAKAYWPTTRFLHLGYERGGKGTLYKVYLEQQVPTIPKVGSEVLLHYGFKWDAGGSGKGVVTEYIWHVGISMEEILRRMEEAYGENVTGDERELAREMAMRVAGSVAEEDLRYMEVREAGNPRRSFDVNLYDAGARVGEMADLLERMRGIFGIPADRWGRVMREISNERLGHIAGGIHRDGRGFFNIYYGARPGENEMGGFSKYFEKTEAGDGYYNYCWWPYEPVAATEGKERAVNLLLNSFEVGGMDERACEMIQGIRREIGMFKTVWGVKLNNGRLGWEYYFYDYKRLDREVSLSRVLGAMAPWVKSGIDVNERLPYFMFSLDVTHERVRGEAAMDEAHVYIGNPGSRVSSGISYLAKNRGMTLENFYFFFDAKRDRAEVEAKVRCSAHLDATEVDINEILWPELRDCHTICIANKQRSDTAYFAGVTVDQLLWFLNRVGYPQENIGYVQEHRGSLDHLLFDVGFDYVGDGDGIRVIKSGYYGVF